MTQEKRYAMNKYLELVREQGLLAESDLMGQAVAEVELLTYDSREVCSNTLFICKGAAFKEDYLRDAVKKGAMGYISEQRYDLPDVPYIIVKDIRAAMAPLANLFFNSPWQELNVVGIGGTKGKSTSAYYMKAIVDAYMEAESKPESAVISSIDIYDGVITKESHITTPEAVELQGHLRNAVKSGIEYAQMEVSSQALKYHRVDCMRLNVGIFLNVSEDHISPIEHKDFEDYFQSKMKMFAITDNAVVNLESDEIDRVLKAAEAAEKVWTMSTRDDTADFFAYDIRKFGGDTLFRVKCEFFDDEFRLTMPGLFNVENALGTIAAACILGIPKQYIYDGLMVARSSGRMELYASADQQVIAIVDYAHNKLSFETLFSSMKQEYPDYNIVSLFGCPGKKAYLRRKDLGTIAGKYSKKVYIAAEDPGYEPVLDISNDIAEYVKEQGCDYDLIEDRGEAIKAAIEEAEGKTLILVTGKGNETRQKYGSEYIDCPSDVEYVKKYLAKYDAGTLK